jgi:uncharacterized membrane protein YdjX (TVP38/TMEM64 family)
MRSTRFKKVLLALLFGLAVYAVMVLALRWVGLENAQAFVRSTGIWSPIVFIFICTASLIIAPLSGSSIYIAGGALFGKEVGFLLSYLASLLGCSINFWISRKFGRKVATRFIGKGNLAELDKSTEQFKSHHEIFYMIAMMPLSQDVVSYAVGLTKITYRNFFIALAISAVGIVAAYIYLGTGLLEALI